MQNIAPSRRSTALDRFDFLKIAAHAETDPRTVAAYMTERQPTARRATVKAIREALARLGYADPHAQG